LNRGIRGTKTRKNVKTGSQKGLNVVLDGHWPKKFDTAIFTR